MQEDVNGVGIYAICDGHGGPEISIFTSHYFENALKKKIFDAINLKNDNKKLSYYSYKLNHCKSDKEYFNYEPEKPKIHSRNL